MNNYRLENDIFIIEDYDKKKAFCSFLPGLTGEKGVPIWSFYVNRGQCITSFGVDNKDNPIMEFVPANIAYENTAIKGFRTFVRKNGVFFEPFCVSASDKIKRNLYIKQNSFKIEEINSEMDFKTTVEYFILPDESFGAIVRNVEFENLGDNAEFEILDGMPRIIPYGVSGSDFSRMSYLMSSYNTVGNLENKIPLIFNEISGDDDAEVKTNTGGYFYLTFDKDEVICPVYDPKSIFAEETSLIYPVNFALNGLEFVKNYKQHGTNKICGCFTPVSVNLKKNETYKICSLCGYIHSVKAINDKAKIVADFDYISKKLERADELSKKFTDDIATQSGNKILDMYFRQCYLDNFLRGGYPFVFKGEDKNKVVHLFSRKHGDPERDYNFFSIAAEYYSQGDGNFRDVLQNRRNDVIFHPDVNDFDIEMFFSYVQFDGYNPLSVKGTTFTVSESKKDEVSEFIDRCVTENKEIVQKILQKKFTAGSLINGIYNNNVKCNVSDDELLENILSCCEQNFEGSSDKFGNWSDHFDYLLDLVDSYLKIYPDRLEQLLFENNNYKYFDSDVFIRPRSEKYMFDGKRPRQLDAFIVDTDKYDNGYIKDGTNWLKDFDNNIYKTNLIEKIFSLCVNKFALLDPCQMGIEMEANRAGWCDATNGLPSMFGSGMSETFELLRLCRFLVNVFDKFNKRTVCIPIELNEFYDSINKAVDKYDSEFEFWDNISTAREKFRQKTRYNISGKTVELNTESLLERFKKYVDILETGIDKAVKFGNGFCPTYFKYEPTDFEILNNKPSYPNVKINGFKPVAVSKFLEGPAKYIRDCGDSKSALKMLEKVKESDVYDKKLKMYKTSESLKNEGLEFGRICAFTPGWQENESVFLHMEYKFLLGIFKSGNYKQFYEEMNNVFIPFLNPEVYGRSILENCSFLASSVNPDDNLHGRGFVSRLSGSTTEVVSIWTDIFLGQTPFVYENGKLGLKIKPMLDKSLFDENGEVRFNFLTDNKVIVHNDTNESVYDKSVKKVVVDGITFDGDTVWGAVAEDVRSNRNKLIEIFY